MSNSKMITLQEAVASLGRGDIIAYPTEGVYGLAVDAANPSAVNKLLHLKKRPDDKGFIVMASSLAQLLPWISLLNDNDVDKILNTLDKGYRCTWLVDISSECPLYLVGSYSKLAIRITNHDQSSLLCTYFGRPVVSTSANFHQEAILRTPQEISQRLGSSIAGILEGSLGLLNKSSKIIELASNKVVRE